MRKFIHSSFEIDLSKLKISEILENSWFSDKFFSKFTLPFELDLSDENDINFGFLSYFNANSHSLLFEGKYVHRNIIADAILEVLEVEEKISLTLSYGYDEFPSFKKKLSELPLDKFIVPNIYTHAASIINQNWPNVNYNFPQIHIDKIDNSEEPWLSFEKIINNYKAGAFLVNEVSPEDVTYNRNIIQPVVHILHILKKGFEDGGKILKGDILNDENFTKMYVYTDTQYWTTVDQESSSVLLLSDNYTEKGNFIVKGVFEGDFSWSIPIINPVLTYMRYFSQVNITNPGKYRVVGKIRLCAFGFNQKAWFKIKYRDNSLIYKELNSISYAQKDYNIDVVFETLVDLNPNFISIEVYNSINKDKTIVDVNINPIRLHDDSGQAIATVINKNQVDLTRAVPDMTFGDFVTSLKNWFNLDIDQRGNEIHINFIQEEKKRQSIIDLSPFEIKTPRRKFNRGTSYILKFQDVENKEYKWLPIYKSISTTLTDNYKKDEKTNEIIIDALPLPLTVRNGIQTTHAFSTDNSKLFIVMYDGLKSGLNLAIDPYAILVPQVYEKHWKDWIDYRIKSQGFSWVFKTDYEKIADLNNKSYVFAYQNTHIVRRIFRTEIDEDEFEVDLELEALI